MSSASRGGGGASSSSSQKTGKTQVWEESPHTFTEFGALSSDMKPAGNFFTRLWKRGKDYSSSAAAASSIDTAIPHSNTTNVPKSEGEETVESSDKTDTVSENISMPRPESLASLQDSTTISGSVLSKLEGSDEVLESQVSQRPQHRTLTSVLTRLGSILDQRSTTPQTYKDSDFKQYWMPDSSCRECYDCGDKFTTFRRRHHCRICGQIFCSKCCNQELSGKIIGYKGGIRVCTYCCRVVQRYAQQSTSTGDFKALEDLRAISQWYNETGSFEFMQTSLPPRLSLGIDELSPQLRGDQMPEISTVPELSTPFDLTPQSDFSSQESLLLESKLLIQDSVQLRELWRQMCDLENGVETQTLRIRLRTYTNCIVGRELVDWLIKADKSSTRDQAMAIGQALLYAGYLDCLGNQIPVFRDDFTLYRPGETASSMDLLRVSESMPTIREEQERNEPLWFQEIEQKDNGSIVNESPAALETEVVSLENSGEGSSQKVPSEEENKLAPQERSRSSSFSELPKMNNLVSRDTEEPLPRQDPSVHGLGEDFLKGAVFLGRSQAATSVTCPTGWRNVDQLREENGEKLAYERLKKAHTELWHILTRQLLSHNGLLLSWETIISSVIQQVSHFVRPDVRSEGDDMDIRNYVHIKKVPGGQKNETTLFHGVILSKNVAHKKMKTKITNPLILLLRGTIEFQRVENKFSSLEPQILQEREFMRNCVMKMVAYRPNVVVVEKSVSRLAQEFLLEAGITLLYNVKLSVMERLARFTQAHIVSSIDGLVSKPNMGFCHDFRVQTYTLPNKETKTLTFFDGCATHLGCTVVLSGGTLSELRRVKQILKFMTYTAYNSLLELCFCMDEFALPQPGADEIGQPFEALEASTGIEESKINRADSYSKKEDQLCNWSIKAEELPNKEEPDAKLGTSYEDFYMVEKSGENDEEDLEESINGNLLEGEERRKAMEMAGIKEPEDGRREEKVAAGDKTAGPAAEEGSCEDTDGKGHLSRPLSECVPTIKVAEAAQNDDVSGMDKEEIKTTEEDFGGDNDSVGEVFHRDMFYLDNSDANGDDDACETISTNVVELQFSRDGIGNASVGHRSRGPASTKTANSSTSSESANQGGAGAGIGLSGKGLLSVSTAQKLRHGSDRSEAVDVGSERSTPDSLNKPDAEDPLWDGTPKLVGNIICLIPKSALPCVSRRSSLSPKEDIENAMTRRNPNSTSGIQSFRQEVVGRWVSLDEEKLSKRISDTDAKSKIDDDSGCGTCVADAASNGVDRSLPLSQKQSLADFAPVSSTSSVLSSINSKVKIMRAVSETSSMRSNQSSTSKLTELTDGSDPLLGYQNTRDESIFHSDASRTLKEIKQTRYKLFRRALDGVHLSVSPYHKYHVPFIETDKGIKCAVRKYLPQNIFWSQLFDGEAEDGASDHGKMKKTLDMDKKRDKAGDGQNSDVQGLGPSAKAMVPKSSVQLLHAHPLITCNLTEPIWDLDTQSILADFRARGGRILVTEQQSNSKQARVSAEAGLKKAEESSAVDQSLAKLASVYTKRLDCLDVTNHQRLMVLFSSYSYKSNNHPFPCVYPWVVAMDFYGRNDITLGGFLERFCFRHQYACPSPTCDTPMMDHIRRFVHGNACINVLLKHLESEVPGARDNILMWSWCRKCKQVTPVVPISSDTWSLSFAKYLDLRFHSSSFLRRATAEPCSHSLHHDHFQYFGHRNVVASFKYAPISLKELALPKTLVSLEPPMFDPDLLAEAVKMITYKAMDRYSLMLESTMKLKQEMTSDVQARTISDFLAEQQKDKKSFRESATNIQMKIQELIFSLTCLVENGQTESDMTCHLFSIFDNVEMLKRHICEDVMKWNNKMQEFMAFHQKKSRQQGFNKKDKEAGAVLSDDLEKSVKQGNVRAGSSVTSATAMTSAVSKPTATASAAGEGPAAGTVSIPTSSSTPLLSSQTLTATTTTTTTTETVGSSSGGEGEESKSNVDTAVTATAAGKDVSTSDKVDQSVSNCDDADATGTAPDTEVAHKGLRPRAQSESTKTKLEASTTSLAATSSLDAVDGHTNSLAATVLKPAAVSAEGDLTAATSVPEAAATTRTTTTTTTGLQPLPQTSTSQALPAALSVQTAQTVAPSASSGPEGQEDSTDGWFQDLKGVTRRWLSNSSFTALPLPFDANEHHTLPLCEKVPITVYDYEPSSIVAYTLSSSDYLCRLREIQTANRSNSQTSGTAGGHQGRSRNKSGDNVLTTGNSLEPSGESGEDSKIGMEDASPSPEEKPKIGSSSTPSPHIEMQFSDSCAKFYCRVYFADQFRKLRKVILPGGENRFIRSLSRCKPWEAKGGKSGSAFSKTDDDRFILKQMSNMEVDSFEKFGPQYFQYLKTCLSEEQPTALAKILGVFRIGFRNTQTNHALRQDVLVMENLFYNRRISQKFDLKGSMRNRMVNTNSKRAEEELVLLDENLLKYSVESPLYMRPHSKHVLRSAISSDSTFLSQNLVMDYSLLVGVDDATQELVVGIIDYIRTFTWDKKLEMVVKSSGILGGQGKMPTVVSPQLYKSRFLEAMDRYFLNVPDHWMGLGRDSPVRSTKAEQSEQKDFKTST
ncbi:1-phosphatidylinositol 3-phosphate 5-kinase [Plakobranchus ocellatus]|uniref:1-phosphatidylinositol-3-phosphate 5-kinase n=1 Tax=Plakobranchus ocellatus TaxID=259542 RepID=A0AAV3YN16_9GAST|nr:1-phosphatidylinositol 3-phosphate 5-kinase [Plakobranchus ocellatus]